MCSCSFIIPYPYFDVNEIQHVFIAVLVGIDEYIAIARKIDAQLVGIAAKDGVVIRGYTTHFIDRIIGQTAEPHPGMRQGVSVEAVKDALLNADKIRETRHKSGKISRQYFGKQASSIVSPKEGRANEESMLDAIFAGVKMAENREKMKNNSKDIADF